MRAKRQHQSASQEDVFAWGQLHMGTASFSVTWVQLCLRTALHGDSIIQFHLRPASHGDSIIHFHMGTALLGDSFAWEQLCMGTASHGDHMGTTSFSFTRDNFHTFVLKTLPWWLSKHCTRPA